MTNIFCNHKFQQSVSFFMCLVIVVMIFACIPFTKAEAANPAVIWASDVALQAVSFVLGLLGITFASKGAMVEASNEYLTKNPTISEELNNAMTPLIMNPNGVPTVNMNSPVLKYFKDTLIPSVKEFFSRTETAVSVPETSLFNYQGTRLYGSVAGFSASELFSIAQYDLTTSKTFVKNGVSFRYDAVSVPSYPYLYHIKLNDRNVYEPINGMGVSIDTSGYKVLACKYGFHKYIDGENVYFSPFLVAKCVDEFGSLVYLSSTLFPTGYGLYLLSGEAIENVYKPVPYNHVIDYSDAEFMQALQKIIDLISAGGGVGTLDIPWQIPRTDVEEGKKEAEDEKAKPVPWDPTWPYWWDKLGIKDLIKTLTDAKVDVDVPYTPSITNIPDILPLWGYVTGFVSSTLIWMKLWFSGFVSLPAPLQQTLWAVLILTILTGLMGVFLK